MEKIIFLFRSGGRLPLITALPVALGSIDPPKTTSSYSLYIVIPVQCNSESPHSIICVAGSWFKEILSFELCSRLQTKQNIIHAVVEDSLLFNYIIGWGQLYPQEIKKGRRV
jgi:hypothetical protein